MKKLIVLLFMVCAYAGITRAEYATVDGIRYELNDSLHTAKVAPLENYAKYAGDIVIPDFVEYKGKRYTITEIGESAFSSCVELQSVIISDSVTTIGNRAFSGDTSLTDVVLSTKLSRIGYHAFDYCSALQRITFRSTNIPAIGSSFNDVPLENLVIYVPEEAYETYLFRSNTGTYSGIFGEVRIICPIGAMEPIIIDSLRYFLFPETKTARITNCDTAQDKRYQGDVVIPDYVTYEGENYAVTGYLNEKLFYNSTSMTSISFPNSWHEIPGKLEACGIESVHLPDSLMTIKKQTFALCTSLMEVDIPDNVTEIGGAAFISCYNLERVHLPANLQHIGAGAFVSVKVFENSFSWENIKRIETIEIPMSYTKIDTAAFLACAIRTVVLHDNVRSIQYSAFNGCGWLEEVTIGKSVETIERDAFSVLDSLKVMTCLAPVPPTLTDSVFRYTPIQNAILYVPRKSIELYRQAEQWRDFGQIMPSPEAEDYIMLDGICYYIYPKTQLATVISLEDGTKYAGDIIIPEQFTYNDVTYTVTEVDEIVFGDSPELTSVYLPNTIKGIPISLFRNDSALVSVHLPDSIQSIPMNSFINCVSLQSIDIPDGVMKIGRRAFVNCWSLCSIHLPDSLNTIEPHALGNAGWKSRQLETIEIPENYTTINAFAFESVVQRTINIPDHVYQIDEHAFDTNDYTEEVFIGQGVEYIGDKAFYDLCAAKHVTCYAVAPPRLGENVFAFMYGSKDEYLSLPSYADDTTFKYIPLSEKILYVPAGSVNWYRHSPQWQDFGTILPIQPEVATDHIIVDAEENEALFTWPTDTEAEKYIIDVRCDGEIFCHITLDGNGRLIGIAFAPARAPQSELPGAMSFMVTGLTEATLYTYTVAVLGEDDVVLHVYQGEFATTGYPDEFEKGGYEITPTPPVIPYDPIANTLQTPNVVPNAHFILDSGQLLIQAPAGVFTILGQRIR